MQTEAELKEEVASGLGMNHGGMRDVGMCACLLVVESLSEICYDYLMTLVVRGWFNYSN